MRGTGKALLSLALCAMLWSSGGLFIKSVSWHPLAIAAVRSLFGGVTILTLIGKPKITFSFSQIAAAFCNAGTMLLFVSATKLTTAANAILLQYSAPIFVAVLGWAILKERPKWEHWIALVFITVGISIFFLDKVSAGNFLGNVLAAVSGITFALFAVFMRMQKDGSAVESVLLSHCITFIAGIPFFLTVPPSFGAAGWGALLFLGVFQVGVSSILFSRGIKHVPAVQAMLIAVLEPILNPIWVFLVLGERPSHGAVVGGLIIVAAVTVSSFITTKRSLAREKGGGSDGDGKGGGDVSRRLSESDSAKNPAPVGLS